MHTYLLSVILLSFILSVARLWALPMAASVVLEEVTAPRENWQIPSAVDAPKEIDLSEPFEAPPRPARLVSYGTPELSVIDRSVIQPIRPSVRLAPNVGVVQFEGAWRHHINSRYSLGFLLTRELIEMTAIELDMNFSRFVVSYNGEGHVVSQVGTNTAFRLYLLENKVISPYMSAGLGGNFFSGLRQGGQTYNEWIVSGMLAIGTDVAISQGIALGLRGSYHAPAFHRPYTENTTSSTGHEDAAILNTGFYRAMALVSVVL